MRYICLTILALLLIGCSKPEFDRQRAEDLCTLAAQQSLTPDDTAEMISLAQMALTEVETSLRNLLEQPAGEKFDADYERLMADSDFADKAEIGECMWRILLLDRSRLTESNADAFDELYRTVRLVDLYRDDIQAKRE